MIISFSLLSLSLTCRNGQFTQAAPWPGKVDGSHRRKSSHVTDNRKEPRDSSRLI